MRHQLKPKTPSARARMSYILRVDRYGVNQARAAELVAAGVANLPSWASGPEDFWAGTDAFERANARLCLELELNLPHELSRAGQVAAIADYIDRLSAEAGQFPITWAIHDEGGKNIHCHLMLQERPLDGVDRDGAKAHFKRANRKNPAAGGVAKSDWWHKPAHVFWSRALWADACNQALLREGHAGRFDPRKKSERLDEALRADNLRAAAVLCTQAERHEGVRVAAARRKLAAGRVQAADLPEPVMQIISGNDAARHYNNWLRDWSRTASDQELRLFLADHLHELHQTLEREMQGGHIQLRAAWLEKQHAAALAEAAEREAELSELVQVEQSAQMAELAHLGAVQAAHTEALVEDAQRTAELAELVAGEQAVQAAELARLGAVQSAHAEALIENAERDAELSELVAGEQAVQAAELARLGAVQAAHAEALAEDAQRTAAELERMHDRLRHQLRRALAEGALDRAGGQEILDSLGPDVSDLQGAIEKVRGLRVELAELAASEAHQQAVELGQLAAVQAAHTEALAEDAARARHGAQCLSLIARGREAGWLGDDEADGLLYALIDPHTLEWLEDVVAELVAADAEHSYRQWLEVQAAHTEALAEDAQHTAELDDPATPISHDADADPQWIEFEGQDGDVIGHWSDDPEADDWVEHDPDDRPSSGPRMG